MFDEGAVEMAFVHNCFIRGINAIYLQALHVKPAERKAFLNFAALWEKMVHLHHEEEEAYYFPEIERLAGEPGIMSANVSQHHLFHGGLERYEAYVQACLEDTEAYDGKTLVEIIDSFGHVLAQHLAEEIPTLLDLRKYGTDKFKELPAITASMGERVMKNAGLTTGLMFMLTSLDLHFEGGRWSQFPPIPGPVFFILRHVLYWVHSSW